MWMMFEKLLNVDAKAKAKIGTEAVAMDKPTPLPNTLQTSTEIARTVTKSKQN